jgi:hypothetical protein
LRPSGDTVTHEAPARALAREQLVFAAELRQPGRPNCRSPPDGGSPAWPARSGDTITAMISASPAIRKPE